MSLKQLQLLRGLVLFLIKTKSPPILFMHPSVFGFITLMYVLKNDLSNKAAFEEAAFYEEALECKFC